MGRVLAEGIAKSLDVKLNFLSLTFFYSTRGNREIKKIESEGKFGI
jgi:hypothetical protein